MYASARTHNLACWLCSLTLSIPTRFTSSLVEMQQRSINTSIRRRRRRLGVLRDDSDDELGTLDIPWEWIYDTHDAFGSKGSGIIGAQLGNFRCFIGDCVFLKAEGSHEAWVAIICEFLEDDDGGKAANFMWFSTEREIRNKHRKRTDFLLVSHNFNGVSRRRWIAYHSERTLYHAVVGCQSPRSNQRQGYCDVSRCLCRKISYRKSPTFLQGVRLSPRMQYKNGYVHGRVCLGGHL